MLGRKVKLARVCTKNAGWLMPAVAFYGNPGGKKSSGRLRIEMAGSCSR